MKRYCLFLFFLAGSWLLTACSGGGGGSPTVDTANHLSVAAPATATAGTAFNITVTALDAANHVVTGYSGTVHFSSTDGLAVLPANSTLTNGARTFSATLKSIGGQTMTATDTVTASISGTSLAIAVNAPPSHFSVSAPSTVRGGTAFKFTVTALDAANNVVANYSGTVHFSSTDGLAAVPANSTLMNGMGAFSATLRTVGRQTLTASDTVTASISGSSNAILVYLSCLTQGQQCPPQYPPCCPGLVCAAAGNRAYCEPDPAVAVPKTSKALPRFAPTLPMKDARAWGSATLLSNGSVLITGGDNEPVIRATAELFNPAARSFVPAGDMGSARARHSATSVTGGAVLLVGGRDSSNTVLATAELFDPTSLAFVATDSMSTAREAHTATLVGNGKVLITGGNNGSVVFASAELFDPARMRFAPSGSMGSARTFQSATLLKNGKVLVTGGRGADGDVLATAELFDPGSGRFTPTATMKAAREFHTATLLGDGRVLIAGGEDGTATLATAELFDPTNGSFTATADMGTARGFQTATLLKNGRVLITGGRGADGNVLATAELFDPAREAFMSTASMQVTREFHMATVLDDGNVLIAGGDDGTATLATAELFVPGFGGPAQ
jgi:hypothetical protein